IPGAAEGVGLGHRFLKHVERTRALLHLITLDPSEGRDPLADYEALRKELSLFDPALAKRPQIVAMSKADIPEVREAYAKVKPKFAKKKIDLRLISAATGEGVRDLLFALYAHVSGTARTDEDVLDEEEPPTQRKPKAAPKKTAKKKAEPVAKKLKKTVAGRKANFDAKHAEASPKKKKLMEQNRAKGKANKAKRIAAAKANVNRPKNKGR
ncbi:MAG TPA: hypothetical protein VF407_18465, partial [Polyangiaceae bacterium]